MTWSPQPRIRNKKNSPQQSTRQKQHSKLSFELLIAVVHVNSCSHTYIPETWYLHIHRDMVKYVTISIMFLKIFIINFFSKINADHFFFIKHRDKKDKIEWEIIAIT